jgi:hypothetical protein
MDHFARGTSGPLFPGEVAVAIEDCGVAWSTSSDKVRLQIPLVKGPPTFAGNHLFFRHPPSAISARSGADVFQEILFAPPLSANAAEELVAQHCKLDARRSLHKHQVLRPITRHYS